MASSLISKSEESSLSVSLHPLVILSASEHVTRTRLQTGSKAVRVVGALLGTQTGREIEINNSFEFALTSPETLEINHDFFTNRRDQFKQVFPSYEILGWYSIGDLPTEEDLTIHKQLMVYNESPLFLQLSPDSSAGGKDLPVTIYESSTEIINNVPETKFIMAPYRIETGEAERIAVDHSAKSSAAGQGESALVTNLTTQKNALQMLLERVQNISLYLQKLSKGEVAKDHETLRQISALISSLPTADSKEFQEEYMTEYSDVLLTSYLATLTKELGPTNDLMDRFSVSQSSAQGGGHGKIPRGGMGKRGDPSFFGMS